MEKQEIKYLKEKVRKFSTRAKFAPFFYQCSNKDCEEILSHFQN